MTACLLLAPGCLADISLIGVNAPMALYVTLHQTQSGKGVQPMIIREMLRQECVELLATGRLGRLACCKDARPYVVPIHYAYADSSLYAFSVQGQKIDWMRENPNVCLQVDHRDGDRGWRSVVVSGRYEELPDRIGSKHAREHAWSLLEKHANWWEPGGLKPFDQGDGGQSIFFRIHIESLSGRQSVDE